jgi:hypothetical protein
MKCVNLILMVDGSYRVEPFESADLSTCSYVVQSGVEAGNSLASLTPAQGLEISIYVGSLWALAWIFKQIGLVLNSGDSND